MWRVDNVGRTAAVSRYGVDYRRLSVDADDLGHVFTAPLRDVLWQMLMQGVGSVVVSGISFNMMIRAYGPVRSTMLTAVVPGMSALSAALVLGEPLPWNVLTGLALVTAGIVFGVRQAGAAKP